MRNIFSADNIYQAGLNLFTPKAQARKQAEMLKQMDLTRAISKRQAPLRQQALEQRNLFQGVKKSPARYSQPAQRNTPYYNDIASTAKKYGFNPKFLDAVVFAESSYNPQAQSKTGAYGLTQIQPATLKELGYMGTPQSMTPQQQIDLGAQYLSRVYDRRQKALGINRPLTPIEWYHAYSFGPNTTQLISPEYEANWKRAYGRY